MPAFIAKPDPDATNAELAKGIMAWIAENKKRMEEREARGHPPEPDTPMEAWFREMHSGKTAAEDKADGEDKASKAA